jgi:hypothetical protein
MSTILPFRWVNENINVMKKGEHFLVIMTQRYFIVARKIVDGTQLVLKEEQLLRMYKDKITTSASTFLFSEIHDISFRKLTKELGILYLHTNQGLFPYKVSEEPHCFIQTFYKLKK